MPTTQRLKFARYQANNIFKAVIVNAWVIFLVALFRDGGLAGFDTSLWLFLLGTNVLYFVTFGWRGVSKNYFDVKGLSDEQEVTSANEEVGITQEVMDNVEVINNELARAIRSGGVSTRDAAQNLGELVTTLAREAQHDGPVPNVIKISNGPPEPDPEMEWCDVWVDTSEDPPYAYVINKVEGQHPTWARHRATEHGKVGMMVHTGDTLVTLNTIKSPGLREAIDNLRSARDVGDLSIHTKITLSNLSLDNARELCCLSGFDFDRWQGGGPEGGDERNGRMIDVG